MKVQISLIMQALRPYTGYSNPRYRIGGSVMLGSELASGEFRDLDGAMALPLPTGFAMGRTYRVFDAVDRHPPLKYAQYKTLNLHNCNYKAILSFIVVPDALQWYKWTP